MFKINNGDSRTMCEVCSKLTIKTLKRRQWRSAFWCLYYQLWTYFTRFSLIYIIDFEQVNDRLAWKSLINPYHFCKHKRLEKSTIYLNFLLWQLITVYWVRKTIYLTFLEGPKMVIPSGVPWNAVECRWSKTTSSSCVSTS